MNNSSQSLSTQSNTLFHHQIRHRLNTLITIRGLIILIFAAYLLLGPVMEQTDIIGAVVSISILVFLAVISLCTVICGSSLKKKFNFKIFPPEAMEDGPEPSTAADRTRVSSKSPAVIVIRTIPFSVPPFFAATLELTLKSPDAKLHSFILRGNSRKERVLIQEIVFPHRGDWVIEEIRISFGDRIGLTSFHWTPPAGEIIHSFRIYPPRHASGLPPVISSSSRAGDTISDIKERHGDPYDLKQHHPSDGMRKIAWKIFAKTGELIARHPEHTVTPEGQTLLFCIADKNDDNVCAAALAYMKLLQEREVEAFFLCEGANGSAAVTTVEGAGELLVESVWKTESSSADSVREDLLHLINLFRMTHKDSELRKVIVFCSDLRLSQSGGYEICKTAGECLTAQKVEPLFCIVQGEQAAAQESYQSEQKSAGWLERFCFEGVEADHGYDLQRYRSFINLCGLNNWQVIL